MKIKNQYQRNKIKYKISLLSPENKKLLAIKLYSEGTTLKLMSALFECEIQHLINLFIEHDIKYCTGCKTTHSRNDFHKKNTTDGLNARCYRIMSDRRKYYYDKNRDKGILDSMQWKQNNKERISELRKIRNQDPEIKQKNADYMLYRRHHDDSFRLRMNFTNLISYHLKTHSFISKEKYHWEDLVGYNLNDLILHLESLFEENMTWDNYGQWHVDHIIPVSYFNIISINCQEFKDCWCLENLQPLWSIENLSKSNSLDPIGDILVEDLL